MAELKDNLAEPERRSLVRRIAERGSRGYRGKETAVAPSRDFAAAAEATFKADPVDIPPAAQAELSALVQAPAQDAERYAEAQRAIFQRGQQREAAYGDKYFEGAKTTIGATNFRLAKYEEALRADAAARAAGGGGGSRRGGGGGGSVIDLDAYNDDSVSEEGQAPSFGQFGFTDEPRANMPDTRAAVPEETQAFFRDMANVAEDAEALMEEFFLNGRSIGGAIGGVWSLIRTQYPDLDDNVVRKLVAALEDRWRPQWAQDDRPVIGGSGVLPGEIDPDTGVPTPYYGALSPSTPTSDRSRSRLGSGGITF